MDNNTPRTQKARIRVDERTRTPPSLLLALFVLFCLTVRARGIPQEKRLKGLGAAIPQHAAREAKRDREWKEFLDRPAPAPEPSVSAAQRIAAEVRYSKNLHPGGGDSIEKLEKSAPRGGGEGGSQKGNVE